MLTAAWRKKLKLLVTFLQSVKVKQFFPKSLKLKDATTDISQYFCNSIGRILI